MFSKENLPIDLFPAILRKMRPADCARFRRMNKKVHKHMDEYRQGWRLRLAAERKGLLITVHQPENPYCSFAVGTLTRDMDGDIRYERILSTIGINQPLLQLSGCSFYTIRIKIEGHSHLIFEKRQEDGIALVYEEKVLPILRQLKLSCENLSLVNVFPHLVKETLWNLRFSKIFLDLYDPRDYIDGDIQQWPIQHCSDRYIQCFTKTRMPVSPLLKGASRITLSMSYHRNNSPQQDIFGDLLEDIYTNPAATPHLRYLHFEIVNSEFDWITRQKFEDSFGLEFVWEGPVNRRQRFWNNHVLCYTVKIPNGTAVIVKNYAYIDVFFMENDNREQLLTILVPFIFPKQPVAFSAVYDKFVFDFPAHVAFKNLVDDYFR